MDAVATDLPSKVDETLAVCPRYVSSHLSLLDLNLVNFNRFRILVVGGVSILCLHPVFKLNSRLDRCWKVLTH